MKKIKYLIVGIILPIFGFSQTGITLFQDDIIHEIRLTSPSSSIYNEMYNNHSNYLSSGGEKTYSKLKIEIDGTLLADSVGVRFKGETSFTEISTDKKPFKIDVNKYSSEQTYEDIKKFNLHNARADASMIRDKICYDLFREMGINSPRVSFAEVYLNDEYWGLYSIVEQIDKTYLDENFGNKDGNLYKSSSSGSVDFDNMVLKTNETANDFTKLNNLIDKITTTENSMFEDTLRQYMNVDAYLISLAIDILVLDVDKYWQVGKNFYLYENSQTGKIEWIPWDYNLSMNYFYDGFSSYVGYDEFVDNIMFDNKTLIVKIMNNDNLRQQYLTALCQLKTYFNTGSLFTKIDNIKTLIEPSVLADTKKPFSDEDFEGSMNFTSVFDWTLPNEIPGVKQFVSDRTAFLDSYFESISYTCDINASTIEHLQNNQVEAYPNPVSQGKTVHISGIDYEGEFYLYNLQGKQVLYVEIKDDKIYLPDYLNHGLYIYKVNNLTGKMIIE